MFFPDAQTQIIFFDSIKNSFTLSFNFCSTDRETFDTQSDNQVNIGSAQTFNSPKNLIVAHQTDVRIGFPNKAKKLTVF